MNSVISECTVLIILECFTEFTFFGFVALAKSKTKPDTIESSTVKL
jgi:hypothetical protein